MLSGPSQSFTAQTELNAWGFWWWFIIYSGGKLLSEIYSVRTELSEIVQYLLNCEGDFFPTVPPESLFSVIRKIDLICTCFHPFVKSRAPICVCQISLVSNVLLWILALRNFQYAFLIKPVAEQHPSPPTESIQGFIFQVVASSPCGGLPHASLPSPRDSRVLRKSTNNAYLPTSVCRSGSQC